MPHAVVLIFTQVNLDNFDAAVSFVNVRKLKPLAVRGE